MASCTSECPRPRECPISCTATCSRFVPVHTPLVYRIVLTFGGWFDTAGWAPGLGIWPVKRVLILWRRLWRWRSDWSRTSFTSPPPLSSLAALESRIVWNSDSGAGVKFSRTPPDFRSCTSVLGSGTSIWASGTSVGRSVTFEFCSAVSLFD